MSECFRNFHEFLIPRHKKAGYIFIVALSVTGCASKKVRFAGFLTDYSRLEESKKMPGLLMYSNSKRPLASYTKVVIDHVAIFYHGSFGHRDLFCGDPIIDHS